jgi:hypothetical protein
MTDNVTPIRPAADCPDDFETLASYRVTGAYNRHLDWWENLEIFAGWTPGSGPAVRLGDHDLTPAEAIEVVMNLLAAVKLLTSGTERTLTVDELPPYVGPVIR